MQTEYRNINQGGRARRPARHAANVRVPPQSGGQRAARVRQPGPYGYPAVPGPRTVRGGSSLFYKVFNAHSQSAYRLRTDAFRLVTRRAINRVHASSTHLPYRKAAYAASGLKMTDLEFDGRLTDNSGGRFALAMDSLALYTDAGYKLSAGIAIVMMFLALAELAYTLIIFCAGHPIEGWTTMMFVLTLGFAGLFAVLTIIIKYLSLLVDLVFKKQNYLIESIEKIQK